MTSAPRHASVWSFRDVPLPCASCVNFGGTSATTSCGRWKVALVHTRLDYGSLGLVSPSSLAVCAKRRCSFDVSVFRAATTSRDCRSLLSSSFIGSAFWTELTVNWRSPRVSQCADVSRRRLPGRGSNAIFCNSGRLVVPAHRLSTVGRQSFRACCCIQCTEYLPSGVPSSSVPPLKVVFSVTDALTSFHLTFAYCIGGVRHFQLSKMAGIFSEPQRASWKVNDVAVWLVGSECIMFIR